MLHKHTHLPLCVLTACGHWTMDIKTELFDLQAQKYIYLLRSSDSQYRDKIW